MPDVNARPFLKWILFAILVFGITLLIIVSALALQKNKTQKPNNAFVENVIDEIRTYSNNHEVPTDVEKDLSIATNSSLSLSQRSEALSHVAFYLSNEYSLTHSSQLRLLSQNVVGKYAKDNFPKYYNASIYNFTCADPTCGKALSSEIKQALDIIQKSSLREDLKLTITENLTNAGYMKDEDASDKVFGIELSINDLRQSGNAEASSAANILVKYLKDNYKVDVK